MIPNLKEKLDQYESNFTKVKWDVIVGKIDAKKKSSIYLYQKPFKCFCSVEQSYFKIKPIKLWSNELETYTSNEIKLQS